MSVLTIISWSEVIYRKWTSIENEHNVHPQTVTVEFQAFLWVFDARHEMIEAVLDS